MRKIALVLTVIIFCCSIIGAAAYDNNSVVVLSALGILPDTINEVNLNQTAVKEDFAYMTAKMIGLGELEPKDTIFQDVKSDNSFSGYIDFLTGNCVMTGETDSIFNPKGAVTLDTASRVLVNLLGYKQIAENKDDNGYVSVAVDLGLYSGVNFTNNRLTNEGLVKIISNALEVQTDHFEYTGEGQKHSISLQKGAKTNILGERLGVSVYTGVVTGVNEMAYSAVYKVTSNKYKTNKNILKEGSQVTFDVRHNIDINLYVNVPATIWVNSDEEIICITPLKNVEIKFTYVYSVNGDSDKSNTYSVKYINRLTLYDDETKYKVSKNAELSYNGEKTSVSVPLIQNFAKLVFMDNEIIYIECWDLKEGGIIGKITNNEITYTKGGLQNSKIRDFDKFTKKLVYIDGESMDVSRLNTNSVFDYYEKDDYIVIVATEKIVTEKLYGVGDKEIQIGNISYNSDKVYYSTDGVLYKDDNNFYPLLNCIVDAYFNPNGNCVYVKLSAGENESTNKFIGVVGAYEKDNFGNAKIEIWKLEPAVEKKIYELDKKVNLGNGLVFDDILLSKENIGGDGIYEFETNIKSEITSINKAEPFYGFGEATASISSFPDDIPYLPVNGSNLYFQEARIVALYTSKDEFGIKEITWAQLRNKPGSGAKMKFFGDEESSDVRLAVLCGNTKNIYNKNNSFGVIVEKKEAIDADGVYYYNISINGNNGPKTFRMSEESAKNLPENAFVIYRTEAIFSDDAIVITSVINVTSQLDDWTLQSSFKKGIVKKIDSKRVYFDDGSAIFMHPSYNFVLEVDDNNESNRFKSSSLDKIDSGDTITYYYYGGDIIGIFLGKK